MIASRRHFATENRRWELFDRASLSCSTSCLRLWTSYKELIKSLKPSSYSLKGNNFKTSIWFCSRSQLSLILILDCKWDFEKFLLFFCDFALFDKFLQEMASTSWHVQNNAAETSRFFRWNELSSNYFSKFCLLRRRLWAIIENKISPDHDLY